MFKYTKFQGLLFKSPLFKFSYNQLFLSYHITSTHNLNDEENKNNSTSIFHQKSIINQYYNKAKEIPYQKINIRSYSALTGNNQRFNINNILSKFQNENNKLEKNIKIRNMSKKNPYYPKSERISRKDRKEQENRSPFGPRGTGTKHFKELKFYHARNRNGQKQTLINPFRKDIDFFDPVRGGFENYKRYEDVKMRKMPRKKYYSDDESELDENLFDGYSDNNDEDIYFGGGNDEDADFDDDGNPLRPKLKNKKRSSIDDDERDMLADEKVPLPWTKSNDDVEYDELFGKGIRTKKPTKTSYGKLKKPWKNEEEEEDDDDDDEFVKDFKTGSERGDFNRGPRHHHGFNTMPRGRVRPDSFKYKKGEISLHELDDEEQGGTDDDLDPKIIKKDYDKKRKYGKRMGKSELEMTADAYLKSSDEENDREYMRDDDYDTDWEEQKMIDNCAEERDELGEISEMIREFDRPTIGDNIQDVTEEDVKMRTDPGAGVPDYESDDPHNAVVDDPALLSGIEEEDKKRKRRLKTTRLGRRVLAEEKKMELDMKFYKGPEFKVEDYENALKNTPYRDGDVLGSESERQIVEESIMGDSSTIEKEKDLEEIENLKKELGLGGPSSSQMDYKPVIDKIRQDFDESMDVIDIEEDFTAIPYGHLQKAKKHSTNLRGDNSKDIGKRGYRRHATTLGSKRHLKIPKDMKYSGYMNEWEDLCKAEIFKDKLNKKKEREYKKEVEKARVLKKYWAEFPNDSEVYKIAKETYEMSKIKNPVYCAMDPRRKLVMGIGAPYETLGGGLCISGNFQMNENNEINVVKIEFDVFKKLKQRGEILTGAPARGDSIPITNKDWTGKDW